MREHVVSPAEGECLYEILQVSPRATPEVINAAYRVLVRTCHPDVSEAADGAERIRHLNAANYVLSNPERRALYDARRAEEARVMANRGRSATSEQPPRPSTSARLGVENRAHGSALLAYIVTATVAVVVVLATLMMLWSLYDALDDRGTPGFAVPSGTPSTTTIAPWAPPPGALTGSPLRQTSPSCETPRSGTKSSC